ncbi:MAG TPA: ATP-binding protein [Blastocatellia bacterium]|nr:ATP-binding protein [Blastocatellia bacterium]
MKQLGFKSQQRSQSRRWQDDRQAILEFNKSLTLIVEPDSLMASISARIRELFGADRIVILGGSAEASILTIAFSHGYQPDELKHIQLTQQDRLPKWLLTNESSLIVNKDPGVFEYLSKKEQDMLRQLKVALCVPLIVLNRLTGIVLLSSSQEGWVLSDEDLSLLQMLTSQASIAFENAYLYQQQRDRLRRLYRAERLAAAGQLAASVAHEIRNPLTAIRSTVQYLLGEFDENNPKRSLVEGVIAEVDRIDRTVDGLLSLTRRQEFKPERLDLGQLVDQSLVLIRTQARNQATEIIWNPPSTTTFCMGDVTQLRQLFLNLFLNALQAMPDGGKLTVNADLAGNKGAAGEKDWCHISIVDTGCGISAQNLERIFDPFFTTKHGGTGLGLSISYAIVKQHGGGLEIHSAEGKGTSVAIRLPLIS